MGENNMTKLNKKNIFLIFDKKLIYVSKLDLFFATLVEYINICYMTIRNVPLSTLSSHPLNNEIYQGNMDIDDLTDNIKKVGLLETLVVIPSGKRKSYYVISGNRRLKSLISLGITKIDVNYY
jgi:hypothetical protein